MKTDLLLLTLLYALAFTAFIGAINSRGQIRILLSYFLAILTLCAAVFHTSQYLVRGSFPGSSTLGQGEEAMVVTPPAFPSSMPEPAPISAPAPITPPIDSSALALSNNQVAIGESKHELKGLLEVARRISKNLTALNLGSVAEVSDEEYEALQNKTVGFLSEARKTKEKLLPVVAGAPESVKATAETLSKGVESLVVAAFNAERFFKAENDTEEKAHLAAFRKGNQNALALLKKVGTDLGSDTLTQSMDAGE
jgi:hypothetical protein